MYIFQVCQLPNSPRMLNTMSTTNKAPALAKEGWTIQGSRESHDCYNAMRQCTEVYFVDALKQCDKNLYKLAIGIDILSFNFCVDQLRHEQLS